MPKKLSSQLRERLENHQAEHPLPSNYFVLVHWPQLNRLQRGTTKTYSSFKHPVTMHGTAYTGRDALLDFNGNSGKGFVWTSDNLYYGASCGFRVFDEDDVIQGHVQKANRTGVFPRVYIRVWLHFSEDCDEINSGVYGDLLFDGLATRVEIQSENEDKPVAKVWGGHEGIVVSRSAPISDASASVIQQPIAWSANP